MGVASAETQDSVQKFTAANDALAYGLNQPSGICSCSPSAPKANRLLVSRLSPTRPFPIKPASRCSCPYCTPPPSARMLNQPLGSILNRPVMSNPYPVGTLSANSPFGWEMAKSPPTEKREGNGPAS